MASPTGGPAAPKPSPDALIRLVVEKGWATRDQIQAAVQYQARKKVTIAQAFIDLSILSEAQVRRALEKAWFENTELRIRYVGRDVTTMRRVLLQSVVMERSETLLNCLDLDKHELRQFKLARIEHAELVRR